MAKKGKTYSYKGFEIEKELLWRPYKGKYKFKYKFIAIYNVRRDEYSEARKLSGHTLKSTKSNIDNFIETQI